LAPEGQQGVILPFIGNERSALFRSYLPFSAEIPPYENFVTVAWLNPY
jgi:hypothetical protein